MSPAQAFHSAMQYAGAWAQQGRWDEAAAWFEHALQLHPESIIARRDLGSIRFQQERYGEAIDCYQQVLRQAPDDAKAHYNLGVVLERLGQLEQAAASYERALHQDPQHIEGWNNLGNVHKAQGDLEGAIACYQRVLSFQPEHAGTLTNLANARADQGRYDEAVAIHRRVIQMQPGYAVAHNDLGKALADLGRFDEALAHYEQAMHLQPDFGNARFNRALVFLVRGDFERGWPEYEWRWKQSHLWGLRTLPAPRWEGESLTGRTILLHAEQGLGDSIQFLRYAPLVKQRGGTVVFECRSALLSIAATCKGIDHILPQGEALPAFDVHAPLLSLPGIFGTELSTIPSDVPYLHADPARVEHWRGRLASERGLKIGIVWQGRQTYSKDRIRSAALEQFAPLSKIEGAKLFSLQVGTGSHQLAKADFPVIDLGTEFDPETLADLSAVLSNLDLLVSVDTAPAHLAGALGVPVWLALPSVPDWRWLLDRTDSPWYPSMRLFRQSQGGDWSGVFERMAEKLRSLEIAQDVDRARTRIRAGITLDATKVSEAIPFPQDEPTGPGPGSEFERRKHVIARRETDVERWSNPRQLETAWDQRAQMAADFLPAGATVLDLGCGRMALERYLPMGCTYVPCDVVARDTRTMVCDFNKGELPPLGEATHLTLLGVLEYLYDLPAFLRRLHAYERLVVVSYNPTDFTGGIDRPALGWVNHWSEQQLIAALQEAGFSLQTRSRIDATQVLLRLSPQFRKPLRAARVLVLSALYIGNFGDRLGYHLINEVLPAQATVHNAVFNFQADCRLEGLPPGDFDLVVLGIGNSVFDPMLTDELFQILERTPRAIGIFGTQYRESIDPRRLGQLLDRLDTWYARYEEDILFYGRGRSNVVHLGDWLISACPMTWGRNPETLTIGAEIWQNLPLDRTIQRVQAHARVFSTRLHPLLCALTSADQVAYRDQREHPTARPSGKFRSMLLDVFGRTYPEDQFFDVDRDAVAAYKMKVQCNMDDMRSKLASLLGKE